MCHSGEETIHILQNRLKFFSMPGRFCRQSGTDITGLGSRKDGERFNGFIIIGNPVDDSFTMVPESIRRHVKVFLFRHLLLQ